jgi:hypothetical protein
MIVYNATKFDFTEDVFQDRSKLAFGSLEELKPVYCFQ